MKARKRTDPRHVDAGPVFTCLAEWAAKFHDDSSPARVTDVLVAFAFVAGVSFAAAGPAATAALLCRVEQEMPSASKRARLLARALLDAMADEPREDHDPTSPSTQTGMAALRLCVMDANGSDATRPTHSPAAENRVSARSPVP